MNTGKILVWFVCQSSIELLFNQLFNHSIIFFPLLQVFKQGPSQIKFQFVTTKKLMWATWSPLLQNQEFHWINWTLPRFEAYRKFWSPHAAQLLWNPRFTTHTAMPTISNSRELAKAYWNMLSVTAPIIWLNFPLPVVKALRNRFVLTSVYKGNTIFQEFSWSCKQHGEDLHLVLPPLNIAVPTTHKSRNWT